MRPLFACALALSLSAADPATRIATLTTSHGVITVELWPEVAPETVVNFIGLANGTKEAAGKGGAKATRPYYDGLVFHRVIANFMLQGGCPEGTGSGGPGYQFADEIDAVALGLDRQPLIPDANALTDLLLKGGQLPPDQQQALMQRAIHPNCGYQFREIQQRILGPRLQQLGLTEQSTPQEVENAVRGACQAASGTTLVDFYTALGYRYTKGLPSKAPLTGCICMANAGPNTNGSQFFINLVDTPHLAGKHTVFGKVTAGMDVVQAIGAVSVDPQSSRPLQPVTIVSIRVE